jgi:hypothetical protein
VAHPSLLKTHGGTPQNVASGKGDTKLYVAINMYLYINICPVSVQRHMKTNNMCLLKLLLMNLCVFVCIRSSNYES